MGTSYLGYELNETNPASSGPIIQHHIMIADSSIYHLPRSPENVGTLDARVSEHWHHIYVHFTCALFRRCAIHIAHR